MQAPHKTGVALSVYAEALAGAGVLNEVRLPQGGQEPLVDFITAD